MPIPPNLATITIATPAAQATSPPPATPQAASPPPPTAQAASSPPPTAQAASPPPPATQAASPPPTSANAPASSQEPSPPPPVPLGVPNYGCNYGILGHIGPGADPRCCLGASAFVDASMCILLLASMKGCLPSNHDVRKPCSAGPYPLPQSTAAIVPAKTAKVTTTCPGVAWLPCFLVPCSPATHMRARRLPCIPEYYV